MSIKSFWEGSGKGMAVEVHQRPPDPPTQFSINTSTFFHMWSKEVDILTFQILHNPHWLHRSMTRIEHHAAVLLEHAHHTKSLSKTWQHEHNTIHKIYEARTKGPLPQAPTPVWIQNLPDLFIRTEDVWRPHGYGTLASCPKVKPCGTLNNLRN